MIKRLDNRLKELASNNTVCKKHFYNQTPLYERNYKKLMCLVPEWKQGASGIIVNKNSGMQCELELLEQHKYTTIVQLVVRLVDYDTLVPNPILKIRVYHDAKVAEVINYSNHANFHPDYSYPNKKMFLKNEKQQVNLMLGELLDHYVKQHHNPPLEILDRLLT